MVVRMEDNNEDENERIAYFSFHFLIYFCFMKFNKNFRWEFSQPEFSFLVFIFQNFNII
jgi:hypothetical protein